MNEATAWRVCLETFRETDSTLTPARAEWRLCVGRSLWQWSAAFYHQIYQCCFCLQRKFFQYHVCFVGDFCISKMFLHLSHHYRWHVWPVATVPTLWSHSGISLWSSLSVITATAGSLPLRLPAIWRRCWPSSPRLKLWKETSTPAISVTVSERIHSLILSFIFNRMPSASLCYRFFILYLHVYKLLALLFFLCGKLKDESVKRGKKKSK